MKLRAVFEQRKAHLRVETQLTQIPIFITLSQNGCKRVEKSLCQPCGEAFNLTHAQTLLPIVAAMVMFGAVRMARPFVSRIVIFTETMNQLA